MKQNKGNNRKMNKWFFLLVLLCAIIFFMIKTIAEDNLNMRQVRYQLGSTVNYEFSFYTDSPKFHTKASGYDKYKGMDTENNMNSIMATDMVKMQGYGNYEFKPDTNLFSFIDYCYSKDPVTTMACAYRAGTTAENEWNYTKLMSYRDSSVNTDFFKHFWQNMSSLCTNFKDYQDDFFFLHYTYPATQKIGINFAMMRNLQNEGESVKEYLTCLTSYIFSITPQAQVNGMTFGKGDVVPFLYFKDRKHANIDVRHDSEALMDIAKYAYVALIEGWCTLPTPYHLWENEYNFLFGNYEPENLDYDLETLHQWYDETYQRYCKDKGRKGNNLLGSNIEHIIESDYSIEQQLEATEYYLRQVFNELGINSDFKETMARNELMAKYMMQNSNFDATIKDYNVTIEFMTENLQRGTHEEQNTHTVVTSDFQKLEFPYTMDKRNLNHSDEDGISDGEELGNEKWINITEFVKRTYEDAVRKGEPHKATFEEQVEDIIEKNGAYIDSGGNKVYGSVKWDYTKTKVLYRVYDYKSNPKLNDTDFDGIWDNSEKEGFKLDNKFVGGTIIENGNMPIEYYNDFRWFMTSPNKYNDELSVMSLIMSNLANAKTISINQLNLSNNIESFLGYLGFDGINNKGIIKLDEATTLNANVYIGYKEIKYYDKKKIVYGVFIGNLDNNRAYRKLVTNHNDEEITDYYNYIANDIINYIGSHLTSTTNSVCYWVTGKGVAGSVANIVAKGLIDNGNETFCYTFGSPQNNLEGNGTYNIYNIINEDDLIPKMLKSNNMFSKYGEKYNRSIYFDFMRDYIDLFGNNYNGDYKITNSISNEYISIRQILEESWFYDRLSNYLEDGTRMLQEDLANTQMIGSCLDTNKKSVLDAKSTKVYYILSKSINGYDKNIDNYDDYFEEPNSDETEIISKGLVVGNGDEYNPYYTLSNDLQITTNKNDFWFQAKVDGAVSIDYSISSNYSATIFVHNTMLNEECGQIDIESNHLDLLDVDNGIRYGHNTYKVHFVKINDDLGNVNISFNQYQDIKETESSYLWKLNKSRNHIDNDYEDAILYSKIYHFSKGDAPIVIAKELTDPMMNTRSDIINLGKDINDLYSELNDIYNIVTYAWYGLEMAGIVGAAIGLGLAVIENKTDIVSNARTAILDFMSNTYSTEQYMNNLIENSGYHTPVLFVENINKSFAICDYGIRLLIKDEDLLSSIFDPSPKESERWDGRIAYGQLGCVGEWMED